MPPHQRPQHQRHHRYNQLPSSDFRLDLNSDLNLDVDSKDAKIQVEADSNQASASTNPSGVTSNGTSSLTMLRKSISNMFLGSNRSSQTRATRRKRVDLEMGEEVEVETEATSPSTPKTPMPNAEKEKEKNVKKSKSKLFGLFGRARGNEQGIEGDRVIGDLTEDGNDVDHRMEQMEKNMRERMWSRMSDAEKSEDEGDEDDYGVEGDPSMYWSRGSSSHQIQPVRQSVYLDSSSEADVDVEDEEFKSLIDDLEEDNLDDKTRITMKYISFLSFISIIREGLRLHSEPVAPKPIHLKLLDFPIDFFIKYYQELYQSPVFDANSAPNAGHIELRDGPYIRKFLFENAEWDGVRRTIAEAQCTWSGEGNFECKMLKIHIHSGYLRIEADFVGEDRSLFDKAENRIRIPTVLQFSWDQPTVTVSTPSESTPGSDDDDYTEITELVDIRTVFSLLTHILRSDLSASPDAPANASSSQTTNAPHTSTKTAHFYTHTQKLSIIIHTYSFASSLSGASVPTSAWINVLNCFEELRAVDVHGIDCETMDGLTPEGEIFTAKASYHKLLDALAFTVGEGNGDDMTKRMLCPKLEDICLFGVDFDEPFGSSSSSTLTSGPGTDANLPRKPSLSSFNLLSHTPSLFNSRPKSEPTGILKSLLAIFAFRARNLGRGLKFFEICNGFGLTRERIRVLKTCLLGADKVMFTEDDLDARMYESCRANLNADLLGWKEEVNGVMKVFGLSMGQADMAVANIMSSKSNSNNTGNSIVSGPGRTRDLEDFSSITESDSGSKVDVYAYGNGHENDEDIDDDEATLADSEYDSEAMYA